MAKMVVAFSNVSSTRERSRGFVVVGGGGGKQTVVRAQRAVLPTTTTPPGFPSDPPELTDEPPLVPPPLHRVQKCPLVGFKTVAARAIKAGTPIYPAQGTVLARPSTHSIQLTERLHLNIENDARYTAHSHREPTARVSFRRRRARQDIDDSDNDNGSGSGGGGVAEFVALRDLHPGETISFDYNTTEWEMATPFTCAETGEAVRGFANLGDAARRRLGEGDEQLAPHVRALWMSEWWGQKKDGV